MESVVDERSVVSDGAPSAHGSSSCFRRRQRRSHRIVVDALHGLQHPLESVTVQAESVGHVTFGTGTHNAVHVFDAAAATAPSAPSAAIHQLGAVDVGGVQIGVINGFGAEHFTPLTNGMFERVSHVLVICRHVVAAVALNGISSLIIRMLRMLRMMVRLILAVHGWLQGAKVRIIDVRRIIISVRIHRRMLHAVILLLLLLL